MAIIDSTRDSHLASPLSLILKPLPQVSYLKMIWAEWQRRRRYRLDLKRLLSVGPHMIEDIGLSLEDACREIAKPFWQA